MSAVLGLQGQMKQIAAHTDFVRHFMVADRRLYTRSDFQHSAQGPAFNPTDFGYDPQVGRIAMVNNLTLRVGAKLGTLDLSVFADNVLNAHPVTYTRSSATSGLFSAIAPRPRVIGARRRIVTEQH